MKEIGVPMAVNYSRIAIVKVVDPDFSGHDVVVEIAVVKFAVPFAANTSRVDIVAVIDCAVAVKYRGIVLGNR